MQVRPNVEIYQVSQPRSEKSTAGGSHRLKRSRDKHFAIHSILIAVNQRYLWGGFGREITS
jgi:hypothetical protein